MTSGNEIWLNIGSLSSTPIALCSETGVWRKYPMLVKLFRGPDTKALYFDLTWVWSAEEHVGQTWDSHTHLSRIKKDSHFKSQANNGTAVELTARCRRTDKSLSPSLNSFTPSQTAPTVFGNRRSLFG